LFGSLKELVEAGEWDPLKGLLMIETPCGTALSEKWEGGTTLGGACSQYHGNSNANTQLGSPSTQQGRNKVTSREIDQQLNKRCQKGLGI
jgi:hypothetical protein